jgi:hypothetical protein
VEINGKYMRKRVSKTELGKELLASPLALMWGHSSAPEH